MSVDVLAIAAHPDDVEQTCGGTLIKMTEMGYRAGVLDLTAGDMGTRGSPEQRIAESEVAGGHMLLRWRGNLHMPDARLEIVSGGHMAPYTHPAAVAGAAGSRTPAARCLGQSTIHTVLPAEDRYRDRPARGRGGAPAVERSGTRVGFAG